MKLPNLASAVRVASRLIKSGPGKARLRKLDWFKFVSIDGSIWWHIKLHLTYLSVVVVIANVILDIVAFSRLFASAYNSYA